MIKKKWVSRTLLTGLLIVLAAGFLLPMLLTITNAFMSQEELNTHYGMVFDSLGSGGTYMKEDVSLQLFPDEVTLQQFFVLLFQSPEYLWKFWNSVVLVVPIVVGQVWIASMAAYSFTRVRTRLRGTLFFFYVVLMLMPYQVTLVPNFMVSKWLGILGTRWAAIFPGVFAPFSVFLLTRFMQRIPIVQIEAAQLDGAGEWCVFTRIYLPQCRGILYAVTLLVFFDYWNMVEQPLVLLSDSSQYPLSIFLAEINTQDVAIAFAAAVVYMIPPMLLFLHGERHLVAGSAFSNTATLSQKSLRCRRWVMVVAILFFVALGCLTLFLQPLTERFVPQVASTNVTVGEMHGQYFEKVIPTQAILENAEGNYVLVICSRGSSLGERYQVERVPVTVLARDGDRTAVSGELDYLKEVVMEYSVLPEDGQYVRLETMDDQ